MNTPTTTYALTYPELDILASVLTDAQAVLLDEVCNGSGRMFDAAELVDLRELELAGLISPERLPSGARQCTHTGLRLGLVLNF